MDFARWIRIFIGIYISGYGFLIKPYRSGITEALYVVLQPDFAEIIASLTSVMFFIAGGIIIGDALVNEGVSRAAKYMAFTYAVWVIISINAGIHFNNFRVIWTVAGSFINLLLLMSASEKLGTDVRNTVRDRPSTRSHLNWGDLRYVAEVVRQSKARRL